MAHLLSIDACWSGRKQYQQNLEAHSGNSRREVSTPSLGSLIFSVCLITHDQNSGTALGVDLLVLTAAFLRNLSDLVSVGIVVSYYSHIFAHFFRSSMHHLPL